MPKNTRSRVLRHEDGTADEEESFTSVTPDYHRTSEGVYGAGPSDVVQPPKNPDPRAHGRGGRRSMEDMLASQPNSVMRSAYALERIAALEDQIAKLIRLCEPEARELIFRQRASLKRYSPD